MSRIIEHENEYARDKGIKHSEKLDDRRGAFLKKVVTATIVDKLTDM